MTAKLHPLDYRYYALRLRAARVLANFDPEKHPRQPSGSDKELSMMELGRKVIAKRRQEATA